MAERNKSMAEKNKPTAKQNNALVRKIQGKRATAKTTEAEKAAATAEGKDIKEKSSSQMSYDNRLDNLDKLIQLLSSIPLYTPNEAELKVASLKNLYTDTISSIGSCNYRHLIFEQNRQILT